MYDALALTYEDKRKRRTDNHQVFFSIRFLWGRAGGAEVATRYLFIVLRKKERNPFGTLPSAVAAPQKVFLHMLLFFRFAFKIRTPKLLLGFLREKRVGTANLFFLGRLRCVLQFKLGERGGNCGQTVVGRLPQVPPTLFTANWNRTFLVRGRTRKKGFFQGIYRTKPVAAIISVCRDRYCSKRASLLLFRNMCVCTVWESVVCRYFVYLLFFFPRSKIVASFLYSLLNTRAGTPQLYTQQFLAAPRKKRGGWGC